RCWRGRPGWFGGEGSGGMGRRGLQRADGNAGWSAVAAALDEQREQAAEGDGEGDFPGAREAVGAGPGVDRLERDQGLARVGVALERVTAQALEHEAVERGGEAGARVARRFG